LESQYAMSEQRQVHAGDTGTGQDDAASDEATFF
jgi:hypothetical protein